MTTPISVYTRLVKETISAAFSGHQPETPQSHELIRRAACFVSLHNPDGSLRGCIGTLEPHRASLADEIRTNAISAAFHDPRFSPLREAEVEGLDVSVDVLHEPELIDSELALDPSIYGVIVESGHRRGVLLPNLPSIDTVKKQLSIARQKAGIRPNEPVKLYRFLVDRYY